MALINQKNQNLCLYYANNLEFNEILKHHKHFVKKFELAKYNKHRSQGKTTRHRITKKEKQLSKYRKAVHLSNLIIFYKKQIKKNKILKEVNDINVKKSLYDFLQGN